MAMFVSINSTHNTYSFDLIYNFQTLTSICLSRLKFSRVQIEISFATVYLRNQFVMRNSIQQ